MAMALASCNKSISSISDSSTPAEPVKEVPTGSIHISVSNATTKVASQREEENNILSMQVFVFDDQGKLETEKYDGTGTNTLLLTTLTGEKHIWALVNAPRLTLAKDASESSFAKTASSLSDNFFSGTEERVSGLVMVGAYGATTAQGKRPAGELHPETINIPAYVVGSEEYTEVPINVYRLGARISLRQVTVDFRGTSLENAASFKIQDLYLKNVVNSLNLDGTDVDIVHNEQFWTNRITDHAVGSYTDGNFYKDNGSTSRKNDLRYLLCDKGLTLSTSDVKNKVINVNRDWYVYPNSTLADATADTWSPRHTRLVLHAVINDGSNDIDTYYVFPIPPSNIPAASAGKILTNHTYDINNITITMPGKDNDDNDSLTETGKAEVTITVSDWTDEYTLTYEI